MTRRRFNSSDNQSAQPDLNAHEREALAVQMRRLGYEYDEIAAKCGYADKSGAWRALKRVRERMLVEDERTAALYQAQQINLALTQVMTRIAEGGKDVLWAVDRLVPLLKRQSELLGLDAKRNEITNAAQMVIREYGAEVDQT
jgi:hypothetical protein